MKTTELKYWQNGCHTRGLSFRTVAWQFKQNGFLLAFDFKRRYINFQIFKLV